MALHFLFFLPDHEVDVEIIYWCSRRKKWITKLNSSGHRGYPYQISRRSFQYFSRRQNISKLEAQEEKSALTKAFRIHHCSIVLWFVYRCYRLNCSFFSLRSLSPSLSRCLTHCAHSHVEHQIFDVFLFPKNTFFLTMKNIIIVFIKKKHFFVLCWISDSDSAPHLSP